MNDDPFVQLERSHRRLEERLEDLRWAAREARGAAADVDAIRDVAAFFARGVRRHEEDEERSLFPRLRASGQAEITTLMDRLEGEHRAHLALHVRLDDLIATLHATPDDQAAVDALAAVAVALQLAYRSHIDAEEQILFPAARAILDAEALAAMVKEMQERRGHGGARSGT